MMDDLSRTVMDNCPDTYRLEYDTVAFALIAHYDRNWDTSFTPEDMDVYTIEYPIRLVRTANGWRVDEFHCTDFGYGEALFEPPLTEQDAQIPTPDFDRGAEAALPARLQNDAGPRGHLYYR